jgi:divalent metal cation (Fe/Co/Zn/Cd) transporter
VTIVDGVLAVAVLIGLVLNAWLGWWQADPAASLVIVVYGLREGWTAGQESRPARAAAADPEPEAS